MCGNFGIIPVMMVMYGNFGIIPVRMGHVWEFRYYTGSYGSCMGISVLYWLLWVMYETFGIIPV